MEESELTELDLFAAVALVGITIKSGLLDTPEYIAKQAYDMGEAMIVESKRRKECTQK